MGTHDRGSLEDTNTFAIEPVTYTRDFWGHMEHDLERLVCSVECIIEAHFSSENTQVLRAFLNRHDSVAFYRDPSLRGRVNRAIIYKFDYEEANNDNIVFSYYRFECLATPDIKKSTRKIKINKLSRKNTHAQEPNYVPFTRSQLEQIDSALDTSIKSVLGICPIYKFYASTYERDSFFWD
ncbi:hypothetical protein WA158_006494 [Blastocystis sp. Blastoise]